MVALFNTVFFFGVLLFVPTGLAWQLVWTLRRGRLPVLALLPGVTRQGMPLAFWGYVLGLCFALSLATLFAAVVIFALVNAALEGRSA